MDYTWEAIYSDGTTLPQYNEKGEANGYQNIDASKLKRFAILPCCADGVVPSLEINS